MCADRGEGSPYEAKNAKQLSNSKQHDANDEPHQDEQVQLAQSAAPSDASEPTLEVVLAR